MEDTKPLRSTTWWDITWGKASLWKKAKMLLYRYIIRPIFYRWDKEEQVYISRFKSLIKLLKEK